MLRKKSLLPTDASTIQILRLMRHPEPVESIEDNLNRQLEAHKKREEKLKKPMQNLSATPPTSTATQIEDNEPMTFEEFTQLLVTQTAKTDALLAQTDKLEEYSQRFKTTADALKTECEKPEPRFRR